MRTRQSRACKHIEWLYLVLLQLQSEHISAMNIVKIRFCNTIECNFLTKSLILYIEREIVAIFTTKSNINDFQDFKECQVLF